MSRLIYKALLVVAALVELFLGSSSGCSKQPDSAATGTQTTAMAATTEPSERIVTIDNFAFDPQVLTVPAGTKVTWLNRDDVPHTATSSDSPRKFKSAALDTDEKFSHVFNEPGTYPYFCAVHPKMTGKIVVK